MKNKNEYLFTMLQIALLKRAVEKFKSQLVTDNSSVCSDPSPKTSLSSHHRITPYSNPAAAASNLTVVDHVVHSSAGGRKVTTAAIVSHEMEASGGGAGGSMASGPTLVRKSSRASLSKSSAASREEWRAVKWKDREEAASSSIEAPQSPQALMGTPLKEVNASFARLDRKIMHLETLLAKLTDRLSQQQSSSTENEVQQAGSTNANTNS